MEKNRRRVARLALSLRARVAGHDEREGKWQELTETVDVSRAGVSLTLSRRVRRGQVLHLSMPLPWQMRQHGHADPSYQIYALVQRVLPSPKPGVKLVGLEFVGEHPPQAYLEKPWGLFRPAEWRGENRRRSPREYVSEPVWVVYLDEYGREVAQEGGRTVDVSRQGARVCVRQPPDEFDLVRIIAPESSFESLAYVVARHRTEQGFSHLRLRLVAGEWPVKSPACAA
jgi:hypothetical protein